LFLLLTTDEVEKDWGPGGDGRVVRRSNLALSAFVCLPPSRAIEAWWEDTFPFSISIWEEKLESETLLDTCWAMVVVPLADVRLVVEDEVDLN
jgi:hypothetical protein